MLFTQVVQRLSHTSGTKLEIRLAWAGIMRQLNSKVAKTGTLFNPKVKGAAAEVAKHYSWKAFTALTPAAQDEHSWTCSACAQSERARALFGTAVLNGNARGAARADPPLRVSHAPLSSVAERQRQCMMGRCLVSVYVVREIYLYIKTHNAQRTSVGGPAS